LRAWCIQPRADPNCLARNIWLLAPIQQKSKEFFADHDKVPHQEANPLYAGGIGYRQPQLADAMKRLKKLEKLTLH
jgi:arylsulfatase